MKEGVRKFVLTTLAQGAMSLDEIQRLGAAQGYTHAALRQARRHLGVLVTTAPPTVTWALPPDLVAPEPNAPEPPALDGPVSPELPA